MAQADYSIFNRTATEKLRSPDDLDKFVRVTNPSVWTVLAACAALVMGLAAWGVFGAVTSNVSTTGTVIEGRAVCFLKAEDAAKVDAGEPASVNGVPMTVDSITPIPISRDEAGEILGNDYLKSTLVAADWAYLVTFAGDCSSLAEGVPLSVTITVERTPPIALVMGGEK